MDSLSRAPRILVADDDRTVANTTAKLLHRTLNADCCVVFTGDEAVEELRNKPFDVLVTDMRMPGLHGLELVEQVVSEWPKLPLVVMTAYTENFQYVDIIRAGASDFIVKPFRSEELEAKLVRIFRERNHMKHLLEDMDRLREASIFQALAEQKYRSLFQFSMNGMLLLDSESLVIHEANEAFLDLVGFNADKIAGRSLTDLFDEANRKRFASVYEHFQQTGQGSLADIGMQHSSGSKLFVDLSMNFVNLQGNTILMAMFKDVTEQRAMQQQISELAATDSLTGLYNHRMFYVKIEAVISRARRAKAPAALMMLDLDNFKACNDNHGHQIGDHLLKMVGEIISRQVRAQTDYGFRYGGDEFAVLLTGANGETARRIGERIREEFAGMETYGATISIGVVEYDHEMDADALVRAADGALYHAKGAGKDAVYVKQLKSAPVPEM